MRDQILHVPTGIILDLSDANLGHPEGRTMLEAHYHDCHRDKPAFECVQHRGSTNPGLYLKKISGVWWAVHFDSGQCDSLRIPVPMSDEHKRQTEYWARAAEDAGWWVQTERRLSTGTQPDVLIHGTVLTGIEVQRSAMTRVGAVKRTEKAAKAGVSDVWFTDKENYPDWAFRVPTVGQQPYAWRYLPPRRAVLANGVREFIAVRCTVGNFPRCPNGGSWCGRYHPKAEPRVIPVDEVASRFPSGDIVALRIREMSGLKGGVYLFPAESAALYTELTGRSATPAFDAHKEDRLRIHDAGRLECQNVQPGRSTMAVNPRCGCCGSAFMSTRAFKRHQVIGWDGQLICPDSPARYPIPPRRRIGAE